MNNVRENNRGSMIILTVIGIATLLVAVIGATFAYFTAIIDGNPTEPNVIVQSKQLGVIEFATLNQINYTNLIPGRPEWETDQTPTNKLNFTVTSNSEASSKEQYIVYLNVTENAFETDNVVYVLNGVPGKSTVIQEGKNLDSSITNMCDNTVACGDGQYFTNNNYVDHTFAGELLPTRLGKIDAGFTGKMQIGSAELGAYNAKDVWEFEIWVNEIGAEQNIDQGKTIKCYITIELADPSPKTNEPDYDPNNDTTP